METIFQNIVDEFGEKPNLVDDLEEKAKALSHAENVALKEKICRLEETNNQLANEDAHL